MKRGDCNRPLPEMDMAKIIFPSDAIPLGYIRKREPDSHFAGKDHVPYGGAELATCMDKILWWEETVANDAFAGRQWKGRKDIDANPQQFVQDLAAMYLDYGIAKQTDEANLMVRSIQQQARTQARQQRLSQKTGIPDL